MFLRDRGHFRQMKVTAAIQTGAMCPETPFKVSLFQLQVQEPLGIPAILLKGKNVLSTHEEHRYPGTRVPGVGTLVTDNKLHDSYRIAVS
eukprot:183375-Rhodomonas_salina.1